MADSDDEYVHELSDDDQLGADSQRTGYATRTSGRSNAAQAGRTKERWEDIQRSWDLVTEGADGSLAETVEGLADAEKRKRLLRDTTPLQRGIIRHVILILDLSISMNEKDLRPTRHLLSIRHASTFVREFFEQNPISQLGILGMREGICIRVSDMGGNPNDHITALQQLRTTEPKGSPSLQNALEMARGALFHTPSHGTREVLIIYGALLSSDPGDIHKTIRSLVADSIRVSVVGLAARIAICTELVTKTNGLPSIASEAVNRYYGVAMHEQHFRDLLLAHTTPPPVHNPHSSSTANGANGAPTSAALAAAAAATPSLLMMGFPSRTEEATPTLCLCHPAKPTRGGYLCSRCGAKVCSLPAQCPVCDLQLIQSTHLARSYHHLFPLRNYTEVSWAEARRRITDAARKDKGMSGEAGSSVCFACLTPFPPIPDDYEDEAEADNNNIEHFHHHHHHHHNQNHHKHDSAHKHHDDPAASAAAAGNPAALKALAKKKQAATTTGGTRRRRVVQKGASESSRYACSSCGQHFCIDCDVFAHEVTHNCAGCLCAPPAPLVVASEEGVEEDGGHRDGRVYNGEGVNGASSSSAAVVGAANGDNGDRDVEMA